MQQGSKPYQQATHWQALTLLFLLLLAMTLACTLPSIRGEPTPRPSPTPEGDTITFTAPYTFDLSAGITIPGTQIKFIQGSDVYELSINGLQAYRQIGDSLAWRGIIAPGVLGNYRLRLQSSFREPLQAQGEVILTIFNPSPVEIPPTQLPPGNLYFNNISVFYSVPVDGRIPGTTLVYEGEQNQVAELSGTAGYPFFALDDSLLWSGKLRDNVYVRYNVQITNLDEEWLDLQGTAEIWIEE
jgi:hypothetical protein